MHKQILCALAGWTALMSSAAAELPVWHGFNLEGKAIKGAFSGEWREQDLAWMHELGFNFARIMIDHRYWCREEDWTEPDPEKFGPIDEVIGWGRKHQIHIQICFSFPPGIDVITKSKRALFEDERAREAMARHWRYFARRYRDVPANELSFNLFNEPDRPGTPEAEAGYERLVKAVLSAVRAENAERIFVLDGFGYGRQPAKFAIGLPVWQSHHAYEPMSVSHFQASWVKGVTVRTTPLWPPSPARSPLFGSSKPGRNEPLVIRHVPSATVTCRTGIVNREAEVVARADGREVFRRRLLPHPSASGWTNLVVRPGGRQYAGELVEPIQFEVPAADRLEIGLDRGDWLEVSALELTAEGKSVTLPFMEDFGNGLPRIELQFASWEEGFRKGDGTDYTGDDYLDERTAAWRELLAAGQPVMVGEFGVYNRTPHDVALRWMETQLKRWKKLGIGWAMWNFRGSMGILDSGRADVTYEDFHGHKLDRKMLDLLRRYM